MWLNFSCENPLLLIGCGNMGRAMARGWLAAGLDNDSFLGVDPYGAEHGIDGLPQKRLYADVASLPDSTDVNVIVIAVKPQLMKQVLLEIKPLVKSDTLVVSVAAGVKSDIYRAHLGNQLRLVRAMPNTPAGVGKGITGMTADDNVSDSERVLATALLKAVGQVVWLEGEHQMDAVTAVSGSGPAYVFHMVEALAAAGEKEGLSEVVAMQLARQTVIGAGALLDASDDSATQLRQNVTSPGGTTAAGLEELIGNGELSGLMRRTVRAARKRGQELSG